MKMAPTRKRQLEAFLEELYAARSRRQAAEQEIDDVCHEAAIACDVSVTALRLLIEERAPHTARERQLLS